MSIRTKTTDSSSKNSTRLVLTGKRVEGTWVMESKLPVRVRRSDLNDAVVVADNRRVRTLH
ncbi:MAG TPA: hypothetical protein VEC57_03785 [Candidatus Limnocylindrales bacterium]|nr:hypothetical protein [Candidatus Limnocylindrales bacterium]